MLHVTVTDRHFRSAKRFSVSHFVQNTVDTRQEQSCSPHKGNTFTRINRMN